MEQYLTQLVATSTDEINLKTVASQLVGSSPPKHQKHQKHSSPFLWRLLSPNNPFKRVQISSLGTLTSSSLNLPVPWPWNIFTWVRYITPPTQMRRSHGKASKFYPTGRINYQSIVPACWKNTAYPQTTIALLNPLLSLFNLDSHSGVDSAWAQSRERVMAGSLDLELDSMVDRLSS